MSAAHLATTHGSTARVRLTPASTPVQRAHDARLLVASPSAPLTHLARARWTELVRPGDLVVANDAATLPGSLRAHHPRCGRHLEIRLAGRSSLHPDDRCFDAILFGEGDHRTRTEERSAPPLVEPGDALAIGDSPLRATVETTLEHPRFVRLVFDAPTSVFWSELARVGRPVQYAHVPEPLALWDVWTVFAGPPVAFEPPSAGFVLDWASLGALRGRGAAFATLTHAAGLSSTGDTELDRRLPLDEPYRIPTRTVELVRATRARRGRVVAIGTTVVRALEHAALVERLFEASRPSAIESLATGRLGPETTLNAVDVLLSGTHEPGSSHHALLAAFAPPPRLAAIDDALLAGAYRTHEFGDSVWIEASESGAPRRRTA